MITEDLFFGDLSLWKQKIITNNPYNKALTAHFVCPKEFESETRIYSHMTPV